MILRLGSIVLVAISLVVASEFCSFIFLRYIAHNSWLPSYLQSALSAPPWLTEVQPWGAWHVVNQTSRQQGQCFSIALRSNSYGARDRERAVVADPHRTIVLGDSFAEGWGVEQDERVSALLETELHREFLNFAAENDFGPLQYQIIYEQLASRFSHDQVLILFLPDNDFTDNDSSYWARVRADYLERYRPYYRASANNRYEPFYPGPNPVAPPANERGAASMTQWFKLNSWSGAMYRYIRTSLGRPADYSGYFDFTAGQLETALWSLAKIKMLAGARRVTVVAIPRMNDFIRAATSGSTPLHEALSQFGRQSDIQIVDLLDLMPRLEPDIKRYYLSCDGHWSAEGNAVAARAIAAALRADGD